MGLEQLIQLIGANPLFIIISYALLGAGLKYIDAAFDEGTLSKKGALLISPFLGVLWIFTMIIDNSSAVLLSAIILGVLIRGKIDNAAFSIGLFVIVFIALLVGIRVSPLLLVFLTACAFMDEIGNDIIDKMEKNPSFGNVFLRFFFGKRWLLKVGVLYLAVIGVFSFYSLVALYFFDEAYILLDDYSRAREISADCTNKDA